MPRQQVLNYERAGRQFRVTLKRDFLGDPPLVVIISGFIVGIVYYNTTFFDCGYLTATVKFVAVCCILALLYRVLHDLMLIRTVIFDAGTVRIEYHYGPLFDISGNVTRRQFLRQFLKTVRDYCFVQYAPRIYCRKNLHVPVSRVIFLKTEQDRKHNSLGTRKYRYETRIPLFATGGRGIIVTHPSEKTMYEFESQIKMFWQETPYNEEVWYEANPMAALRRYEETVERFDEPQKIRSPKEIFVTIIEEGQTVSIVSQYGGTVSRLIGKTLYWSRYLTTLIMLLAFLGFLGGCFIINAFWNDVEPMLQPYFEKAEPKAVALLETVAENVIPRLPIDEQTKNDWLAEIEKEKSVPNHRPFDAVVCCIVYGYIVTAIGLWVLFLFLRWPFWKRWTVRFEDYALRRHRIYSSWQNDKRRVKRPVYQYDKFFTVIAATPQTHRLVTRREWVCRDPGWKFPLQVVIITSEGAFPIPVNSIDEQEEVITTLKRFVSETRDA